MPISITDPKEPAHPMIVALHDELVLIYRVIREKYQTKIDQAFDRASRQIGFVVTTTIPVNVEIGEKHEIKSVTLAADNLRDTLFEKVCEGVISKEVIPNMPAGNYYIYLIWYPALKLKLRTEWMEPAHINIGGMLSSLHSRTLARYAGKIGPHGEPAHWFDPGYRIAAEEAVLIHAIDEVYPELRLTDRIAAIREATRVPAIAPEVQEPAHFRQFERLLESDKGRDFAAELTALLKKYGY